MDLILSRLETEKFLILLVVRTVFFLFLTSDFSSPQSCQELEASGELDTVCPKAQKLEDRWDVFCHYFKSVYF